MTTPPRPDEVVDRRTLSDLVDAAGDGVVMVNPRGVITYWNRGAERIFGRTADDAVGSNLDLIIPERFRERHWTAFDAAVAAGQSRYGAADLLAVPALKADGTTISIEFSVVLLAGDDGIQHIGAIVRDVTDRRSREMELRRQLSEKGGQA